MSAPRKLGDCSVCQLHREVTWNRETHTWYCDEDWPRPKKQDRQAHEQATEYDREWNERVRRDSADRSRLRDQLYGYRVEDDPHPEHEGSFVAICPEHGVLGDDLTLPAARRLRDEHADAHVVIPAPAEESIVSTRGSRASTRPRHGIRSAS